MSRAGREGKAGAIPDRWLVLSVPAPPRGEEHLLVEALRRLGSRSVEPEGERYVAHLPPPEDLEALLAEAELAVRAATTLADPRPAWRWRPREEWEEGRWRELESRRITDRVVVAPVGGDASGAAVGPDGIRILLGAGPAFGSGDHATTRACLGLLESRPPQGGRVVDVGAGSGILAMAAVLMGADEALALEADPLAAAVAAEHVALNGLDGRVEVREMKVDPGGFRRLGPFHGILANLEAGTLLSLLPALAHGLRPDGLLILSGAHRGEAEALGDAALEEGLVSLDETVEEGWWAGAFRRPGE